MNANEKKILASMSPALRTALQSGQRISDDLLKEYNALGEQFGYIAVVEAVTR